MIEAFTAISALVYKGVDLIKGAAKLAKESGRAEVVGDFIELQMLMMDLLSKYQEIWSSHDSLEAKVKELQGLLETKGKVEHHYNCCWIRKDDGFLDGPYSLSCWEHDRKLVAMRITEYGVINGNEKVGFHTPREKDSASVPAAFLKQHSVLAALETLKAMKPIIYDPLDARRR